MTTYLKIGHLTKRYGMTFALDDIELSVRRGEVLAVLGPNGAGKSTLFGCLLGFTLPTGGEVFLNGQPVTDQHRIRFGYTAERIALYPERSVLDNAAFFAGLKGHDRDEAEAQLRRVGLHKAGKVRQLSKGMLQRLGLAIALCGQPELLILDEPFNGLDPSLLGTLQRILKEEQSRGATLLISTHTISAIQPLATSLAILLRGKLAAFGTVQELAEEYGPGTPLEAIYHQIALQRQSLEEALV